MSVTIDYFFNYPMSLPEIVSDINKELGVNLVLHKDGTEDAFADFLGMEFSLHSSPDLDNDRELDLTNFCHQLGFRTSMSAADARPIQLPAILVVIYALHRSLGIAGMLVYDVQTLLARYVEREINGFGRRLFDKCSNTPFVSFQTHLAAVAQRLPDAWRSFY